MAQFGIPAIPLSQKFPWARLPIPDDPVIASNEKGTLSFASSGKNTRSNQLFINLNDNKYLDAQGFTPIGRIIEGIDILEKIYTGYGDEPKQGKINKLGNEYLTKEFPDLTYMQTMSIIT